MKKLIAPVVCALSIAALPAIASAHRLVAAPRVSTTDTTWVQAAIQADMAQAQAGRLGESKTTNKAAIALAKVQIGTHSELLQSAEKVATKLNIVIPSATSSTYASQLTQLSTLSGKSFLDTYATDEINGYEQFIALTQQEISSGVNGAIKASARFYLPIFQGHLKLAKELANALHISA